MLSSCRDVDEFVNRRKTKEISLLTTIYKIADAAHWYRSLIGDPNDPKSRTLADNFQKGCLGLLQLRLGTGAYDTLQNDYFKSLDDAIACAKERGAYARIFAIQFDDNREPVKSAGDKKYPTKIAKMPMHAGGNHATWHQTSPTLGFWEWSGPRGWSGEGFDAGGRERYVEHRKTLPNTWKYTIYGVTVLPRASGLAPALNAPFAKPTPVAHNGW
jgi:hypothetical protein